MPRSVPLSVRVSDDDAAFLAKFEAPEAKTPSEKLRAILAAARRRHEGAKDFPGCVETVEDMLRPSLHRLREANRVSGQRSDFVMKLYDRLPEIVAELMTADIDAEAGQGALRRFEKDLADQVFSLIEEILDLGLTSRSRSYDPDLLKGRLSPILEILELIKLSREQIKGEAE
ncbi:MAG: hypothetical protein AAGC95_16685 [Pseudomonadota bacterium]